MNVTLLFDITEPVLVNQYIRFNQATAGPTYILGYRDYTPN